MIRLIVTADDRLYGRLARRIKTEGDTVRRANSALDGYREAVAAQLNTQAEPLAMIIIDMSLHAADTLVETLHSRPETSHIPLLAIQAGKRLPFELRRLCTDILEADAL